MHGKFITFEGGDGSGKTTQIQMLREELSASGVKCLLTREPGGSPGGEAIRNMLLTGTGDKWNSVSETLLFQAARVDHVERVIKPALVRGETVLCDRFLDSTIVYQGIAKGLGVDFIKQLSHMTLGDFAPDCTVILDIDPAIGVGRANARNSEENRFENMGIEFHRKIRQGFLDLAATDTKRYLIVDAGRCPEEVHKSIITSLFEKEH